MIQQLSHKKRSITSSQLDDPVILCAADNHYVRPLAVTLLSAVTHLKPGNQLQVVLMDGGIQEEEWQGLKETLAGHPISIHVTRPDRQEIADLGISHHITHTAYFRLLASRLLPSSVDKVIYLDSDTLVLADLTELWQTELDANYCLAAVDIACPFIDARYAPVEYRRATPYLATVSPVRNYRQHGLSGSAPYFNSGVMVLNLKRWRDEQIENKLLACLRENKKFVWCWDQYALNVVFAGQWGKLPARWNQGTHLLEYPDESCLPIERDEYQQMLNDPAIVHFTTEFKPWNFDPYRRCHFNHQRWFEWLDKTAWAGWRPQPKPISLHDRWTAQAIFWTRQSAIYYRKGLQKFSLLTANH